MFLKNIVEQIFKKYFAMPLGYYTNSGVGGGV